jgi:hypothetical protein
MRLLRVRPQNSNWSLFHGVADVPGIDLKALWGSTMVDHKTVAEGRSRPITSTPL